MHAGRDQSQYAEGTRALLSDGASIGEDRYAAAIRRREAADRRDRGEPGRRRRARRADRRLPGARSRTRRSGVGDDSRGGPVHRPVQPHRPPGDLASRARLRPAGRSSARRPAWPGPRPAPRRRRRGAPARARSPRRRRPEHMATTVTRRTIDLAGLDVPLVEATGSEDGPLLTVISGVHGCEYASMDGVRRWTRSLESARPARPGPGRAGAEPARVPRPHPVRRPGRRQEPQPLLPGRPGRHAGRPAGLRRVHPTHHGFRRVHRRALRRHGRGAGAVRDVPRRAHRGQSAGDGHGVPAALRDPGGATAGPEPGRSLELGRRPRSASRRSPPSPASAAWSRRRPSPGTSAG